MSAPQKRQTYFPVLLPLRVSVVINTSPTKVVKMPLAASTILLEVVDDTRTDQLVLVKEHDLTVMIIIIILEKKGKKKVENEDMVVFFEARIRNASDAFDLSRLQKLQRS